MPGSSSQRSQEIRERERYVLNSQHLTDLLSQFLKSHELSDGKQAYQYWLTHNDEFSGFVDSFKDVCKKFPSGREFQGLEYETKLDLDVSGSICNRSHLDKIIEDFPICKGFFPDGWVDEVDSKNIFYLNGDEETSFITSGKGINIKIKSPAVLEDFGIPNQDFVMKRKERVRRGVNISEVISETRKLVESGAKYIGEIERHRYKSDFMSGFSGRIYTVVLDICSIGENCKYQLETEYVGFFGGFPSFERNSELQMLKELLKLTELNRVVVSGLRVGKDVIKEAKLAKERKFDMLKNG